MFGIPYFVAYLILMSCAAPKSTTSSSASTAAGSRYSEDLSSLRPKVSEVKDTASQKASDRPRQTVYVEPKFAVNDKIDLVLDSIDRINTARKYVDGFTIQVYSGKREDAVNTRKQLMSFVPEITSEIQFTEPIFRLKAGKYYNWIDAQADFATIKRYFPAAIVVPEKIPLQSDQK